MFQSLIIVSAEIHINEPDKGKKTDVLKRKKERKKKERKKERNKKRNR
jgi:hypothetical protein